MTEIYKSQIKYYVGPLDKIMLYRRSKELLKMDKCTSIN